MKKLQGKGFTLVELMVVVAILGILVAVAVPIYNAVTDKAARNTCETNRVNATRFYHMARATDNGSSAGQMDTVLTGTLGASKQAEGHYTGLCPSGGEFVVTEVNGMSSVVCTEHGALSEEVIQNNIKNNLEQLEKLEIIKDYFNGKNESQLSGGVSLDSEANHESAIAPDVLKKLEAAGVDISNASWRIYYRGDKTNKKDYNFFWTEPSIKNLPTGTEIKVTKYDALTGKYYTGTAKVGKHKEYSFNIIDVSNTKDWTEFTAA